MSARNLQLPGNPRYQPVELQPAFGYDNYAGFLVMVELAVMRTLADIGTISQEDIALLTPEIEEELLAITTTQMDEVERKVTKHDIRALVRLMQDILPPQLGRWVHIPLTSYDVVEPARILQFRAGHEVVRRKTIALITALCSQIERYAHTIQTGRTHGQHALPITVGFWLATILHRVVNNVMDAETNVTLLSGKISGPVGAYNAQHALGVYTQGNQTFEQLVLGRLGLPAARISTQILPPEPVANYLHSCLLLSGTLAQFGTDARHLMRTEIGELSEPFETGQVGSSTMAHKRNPVFFENTVGMFTKSKAEFLKVLDCLVSEHQRDLVGSSVMRDFPIIVVNLVQQLNTLLRADAKGVPFITRIAIDTEACNRNLRMQGDLILAEPLYIALQMAGYPGDAHELINHKAVPLAKTAGISLNKALLQLSHLDDELLGALDRVPTELGELLLFPEQYTGQAAKKALSICASARNALESFSDHS